MIVVERSRFIPVMSVLVYHLCAVFEVVVGVVVSVWTKFLVVNRVNGQVFFMERLGIYVDI